MPAAVRAARPGWRDPRLWVGVLIVAGSVVAGARVLAAADDSVSVWAAARDLGAGDTVTAADLVVRRVRFTSSTDLGRYVSADAAVPAGTLLVRGIGAGELLPRTALGAAGTQGLLQLPVAVAADQVPPSVSAGSMVDVYLVPAPGSDCASSCDGRPVLSKVTVVAASTVDSGFAASGSRQLVLGVDASGAAAFYQAVAAGDGATVSVVRRG